MEDDGFAPIGSNSEEFAANYPAIALLPQTDKSEITELIIEISGLMTEIMEDDGFVPIGSNSEELENDTSTLLRNEQLEIKERWDEVAGSMIKVMADNEFIKTEKVVPQGTNSEAFAEKHPIALLSQSVKKEIKQLISEVSDEMMEVMEDDGFNSEGLENDSTIFSKNQLEIKERWDEVAGLLIEMMEDDGVIPTPH